MSRSLRAPFFSFSTLCVVLESDVSPAIGSRFPVCVFVGSESDVSPTIGPRFLGLPVCVESDVSPPIGSRFPVWVLFGVR